MLLSRFRSAACCSSSFQLLHVAVSEPCRLSEFTLTGPHLRSLQFLKIERYGQRLSHGAYTTNKYYKTVHGKMPQDLLKRFEVLNNCRNFVMRNAFLKSFKPNVTCNQTPFARKYFHNLRILLICRFFAASKSYERE